MLNILIIVTTIWILIVFFAYFVLKKTKYWFFIVLWEFWAWKTQNTTSYLKYYDSKKEINISNYYTWYNNFQLSSHQDLINILNDIYNYHQYINLWNNRKKIFKFKKDEYLREYILKALLFRKKYKHFKKDLKFNIVLDEASIYFNPRNFVKNFSWKNEKLLDFIYQPRKLNLLMFVVVQSPMELDVKFRRLATYYRKYYKWLWIYRWYKDFYFLNPEEIDLEKAEEVWWWVIMWMNINTYNNKPILKHISYPNLDYDTKELIRPSLNIYQRWSLFNHIDIISK